MENQNLHSNEETFLAQWLEGNLTDTELKKCSNYLINWNKLSTNINAIEILEKNQDKINYNWLSINPSIFKDEDIPI